MKVEFTGIVKKIKPMRTYGKANVEETEFWCVEQASADSKYPNILPFVVKHDPTRAPRQGEIDSSQILKGVKEGDVVNFSFIMRGRQWDNPKTNESRIFVDNKVCSYVKVIGGNAGRTEQQQTSGGSSYGSSQGYDDYPADEGLPF